MWKQTENPPPPQTHTPGDARGFPGGVSAGAAKPELPGGIGSSEQLGQLGSDRNEMIGRQIARLICWVSETWDTLRGNAS